MAKRPPEPKIVNADDINPRHNWDRPIMALGPMAVDFDDLVDFRRLHRYRLARTGQALAKSELGALLVFDQYNIRENEVVALANKRLYGLGSDDVEAINAISGERCSTHPHNFTDRLIRPGDQ